MRKGFDEPRRLEQTQKYPFFIWQQEFYSRVKCWKVKGRSSGAYSRFIIYMKTVYEEREKAQKTTITSVFRLCGFIDGQTFCKKETEMI